MESTAVPRRKTTPFLSIFAWLLLGYALLPLCLGVLELVLSLVDERLTLSHMIWCVFDAHQWDGLIDYLGVIEVFVLISGVFVFAFTVTARFSDIYPVPHFRYMVNGYLWLAVVAGVLTLLVPLKQHWCQFPCPFGMEQIAANFSAYAMDHDERFPRSYTDLVVYNNNQDYLKADRCSVTMEPFHTPGGYGVNGHLFGLKWSEISDPSKVIAGAESVQPGMVLMTERDLAWDRHRSHGTRGCYVVYLDGHTSFLPAGTLIRWR